MCFLSLFLAGKTFANFCKIQYNGRSPSQRIPKAVGQLTQTLHGGFGVNLVLSWYFLPGAIPGDYFFPGEGRDFFWLQSPTRLVPHETGVHQCIIAICLLGSGYISDQAMWTLLPLLLEPEKTFWGSFINAIKHLIPLLCESCNFSQYFSF